MNCRVALIPVLFVLLLTGCAEQPWSPSPDEARTWVSTLGKDTLSVEQFTVTGNTISGTLVERSPSTHVFTYTATLDASGRITTLEANRTVPASGPDESGDVSWTVTIEDTLATVNRIEGPNTGESNVVVPAGVIPTLGRTSPAMFVFNQAMEQMRAGDTGIALLAASGPARPRPVTWNGPSEFSWDFFGSPITAVIADDGQLVGASGALTTVKREVHRVEPYDIMPSAERWAALDAAGQGIGTPSPGATTTAMVDGATIEVRYSQPAMRGRAIWGGLVPFGTVWRTGANAATHMTTSHALTVGDHVLPAGTYTLWSAFSESGGQLIVNAQTNQWGTAHDPAQDLFRVDMTPVDADTPVERFTISVQDSEAGGTLSLSWDTTVWTVPFSVN